MVEPITLSALWPEITLLIGGTLVLLLGQEREGGPKLAPWLTLATLVVAFGLVVLRPDPIVSGSGLAFGTLAAFVRKAGLAMGIILTLVNWGQSREGERGEYLSLMLFSLAGLLLVGSADNLLILFLALELVSIPTYIMVVISRSRLESVEAGTKYFYLGAMSAAIMAYGFAFLYGVTGSMALGDVVKVVSTSLHEPVGTLQHGLASLGVLLSIGGILFKLAAVPLHFYVADVYQGAASPVAGLLGFVPKLAGVVAVFRIVQATGFWDGGGAGTYWLLWIVAALSMTIGNVLALRQTNIKRLLGYSGIAHAGYMLVGILAGPNAGKAIASGGVSTMGDGTAAVLFYVFIYGLANLGAFAVLGLLRVREGPAETLRDVAGLVRREPAPALLLVLAMFTLMGLPPTPGFWGKLSLFGSALTASRLTSDTALVVLVIIAVLNSAMAAAYYLRVIAAVLLYDNERPAIVLPREALHVGALLCGFLTIFFAFYPNALLASGREATIELREPVTVITPELDEALGVREDALSPADFRNVTVPAVPDADPPTITADSKRPERASP